MCLGVCWLIVEKVLLYTLSLEGALHLFQFFKVEKRDACETWLSPTVALAKLSDPGPSSDTIYHGAQKKKKKKSIFCLNSQRAI